MTDGPFLRSGMAALSDLRSARWQELFGRLEKEQADFLSHEASFRSAEYRWPRDAATEFARVLKTGGLLELTIDMDLGGNAAIGVSDFRALMAILREKFDFKHPDATVHPAELIRTDNGPYPLEHPGLIPMLWFYAKQWVLKPLLLRRPLRWEWPLVAVMGMTLVRKS